MAYKTKAKTNLPTALIEDKKTSHKEKIRSIIKKPKEKFEITVIHVFTACILAISLFAFVSDTQAAEIKTNNKIE